MITQTCRENLLTLAMAYRNAEKIPLRTVSRRAYGNMAFFEEIRRGKRKVSIQSVDQLVAWFRQHWPEGAEWPSLKPLVMD